MNTLLDMFIRIKNAQAVGHERLFVPYSNLKYEAAKLLKKEGLIEDVDKKKKREKKSEFVFLEIRPSYKGDEPKIKEVNFFSKPSRHLYVRNNEINKAKSGNDLLIISTSKGLMTDREARKNNVGGELLVGINLNI